MSGKLTLRRFNGIEVYSITRASFFLLGDAEDDDLHLNLEFETDSQCIERTTNDTADEEPSPSGEISIYSNQLDLNDLTGRTYNVESGDDEKRGEFLARLYYFEHE